MLVLNSFTAALVSCFPVILFASESICVKKQHWNYNDDMFDKSLELRAQIKCLYPIDTCNMRPVLCKVPIHFARKVL